MKTTSTGYFPRAAVSLMLAAMLALLGVAGASAASLVSEQPATLSWEEAIDAALQAASLKAEDVLLTKVEEDREGGRKVYEIEFLSGESEYEYELDATSGEVVKFSRESLDRGARAILASTPISLEEAKALALAEAGVTEAEAVFTGLQLDHDDGVVEYEIKFTALDANYEVELDATTGELRGFKTTTPKGGK